MDTRAKNRLQPLPSMFDFAENGSYPFRRAYDPGINNFISRLQILCFFILAILGNSGAIAQVPFFSTLSVRDGLPSNVVSAVAQDKHQFIWVGTGNGLCRYDGYRFQTFKKSDSPNSLPANEISSLLVDDEYLWVGTWRGLCKINTVTFEITRVEFGSTDAIRTLYKGRDQSVWIGTANGLFKYTRQNNRFEHFTTTNSNLSHNTIRSLYEDRDGNLWVGTYDKLNKLLPGKHAFVVYDLKGSYKPSLKNNLICGDIKSASATVDTLLWIGTETGLCLFNTVTGQYRHFAEYNVPFSNEVIKCLYSDDDGNLWLGSDFGLNIFSPSTNQNTAYFHNPQLSYSIANNVIWQIFEDRGGVIWFATSNGLSRLNKHRNFYQYHEVSYSTANQTIGNQVKSVLVSTSGMLWLATLHGVIRMDPEKNTKQVFETHSPEKYRILFNNVYALEEDNAGRIWIGTAGGINVWDERKQKMYAITANASNGLISNYIAKFTKGSDGSFWISAWEGGLFKVDGNVEDLSSLRFTLVGDFGSEKNVAGTDAIWAVRSNELFKINLASFATQPVKAFNEIARGKDISSLCYGSKEGSLWAGTQNGLIEYNPQQDQAFFYPVITGNDINLDNIIEDREGNIWGAANNFILKFNTRTHQVEIFPLDKDIPLKSFFYGCSASTSNGDLIFGGDNGYIRFSPALKPNVYEPDIRITNLEINNKSVGPRQEVDGRILLEQDIAFTEDLVLNYAQRSIAFEFSSLHYWQPSMNIYAYKLDGVNDDWNYVSGIRNFAVYANLSPGTYTLHVKGTNNFGIWSDREATVNIRVKPPLFLSRGFLILYAVLLLAIAYISLRIYTARLHLKNELKIARLEKQHADEIYQTKQQFFTNISHELRTPISLILPPIQQILKKGGLDQENEKLITLAEKNSHRLLRVVNQILDVRKLENDSLPLKITSFDMVVFCRDLYTLFTDKAHRNEIDFSFSAFPEHCTIWGDTEKIETILFNLLSNAFKFTPRNGKVAMALTALPQSAAYPQGAIRITVTDTGIGIAREEQTRIFERFYQTSEAKKIELGSGIGLTLAAEYVKLHHGEITLESEPGKGSSFAINLPLGNLHFPVDSVHDQQEINLLATRSTFAVEDKPYHLGLESSKPLVLIIEDNPDMIDFIRLSLREKYNFITASNGEEGLAKANNFLPEVIVSDIMMPLMDGVTMCKKIKEHPKTSHISVIMLTAKSLTAQKVEGIRSGADSYVTKPFEIELLEAHIDHLLKRKKELADYFRHELIVQPSATSSGENVDDKFIRKVMSIIEANISNPDFSVEMLSDEIGMSTTHLYRKLKSLTHFSANDIIRKYRIKKASLLLRNKEGNISEIMYEVGFSNLSYFSKCFRAEFGMTPKEYQGKSNLDVKSTLSPEQFF